VILEALVSSARSGEAWWRPELWRLEAELRLKLPTPDEAAVERLLLDALELAASQESRSLQLRTAASLLRLRTEQGRPRDDAQRLLADSVRWFTEGHGRPTCGRPRRCCRQRSRSDKERAAAARQPPHRGRT
jgi:predicted ATPase